MDYYLIKGEFHVVGYSPDGDSLMFEASNKKHWEKIVTNHRATFNEKLESGNGSVQLRLQGIDALETHYSPSPVPKPKDLKKKSSSKAEKPKMGKFRQPAEYGDLATAELLEYLGVEKGSLKWKNSGWGGAYLSQIKIKSGNSVRTYKKKNADPIKGYVVVNDMDRKGRPIAWVFPGKSSSRDGSRLSASKLAGILKKSGNYKLVSNGLVYPYFFFTLEAALRDILMHAVTNAQRQKMNIWSSDKSSKGITTKKFSQITDKHLIFPYLFRRMVKHQYRRMMEGYWEALNKGTKYTPKTEALFLDTFFDDTNPYIFMIKEREFKRLNEVIRVTKTKIKFSTPPENIVFLS